MPKSYGLIRVSTAKQEKSPKVQEAMIDARAGRLDAQYMGCLIDEATSGYKVPFLERPAVVKLTEILKPGDHVIIWKLDRVARTMRDICDVMDWCRTQKIHLHVLNYGDRELDLGDDIGKIVAYALTMGGEMEAGLIRARTREGLQWRKANGLPYHGRPQFGYRRIWGRHKTGPRKGSKKLLAHEWSHEEWALLSEIYRRHTQGDSFMKILKSFKASGHTTADGNPWGNLSPTGGNHHRIRRAYHFVKAALERGEIEFAPDGITIIPTSPPESKNDCSQTLPEKPLPKQPAL